MTTKYTTIEVKPIVGTKLFYTTKEYYIELLDKTVPKGYITDLGSIPKIFWAVVSHPASTGMITASVAHDFCRAGTLDSEDKYKKVDDMFRALLLDHKYGKLKSYLAWKAVRFDATFSKQRERTFTIECLEDWVKDPYGNTKFIGTIPLSVLKPISKKYDK